MQTLSHDVMNRLQQIGGEGSVVVEGTVNEYADITVNSVPANLFEDPLLSPPGYRYRAPVPVVTGANTITVTATDQDQDVATTQWSINVPASQRTFTYDANGNMLTDSAGRVFTWDAKNRLKSVTVSGTTYEWDYDYRDRRVREFVYASGGSKPTIPAKQFIWHGNDIVQERVGTSATAGTISRNHFFGGFTIGATVSTAAKYQTFTDHLGHVREVVAASGTNPAIGTVLTRYEYSPYQGPTKVYQFPGTNVEATFQTIGRYYHHEPSGLELALYRAYDPELGRWISEDPLEEEGGLNLYGFVEGGPIGSIDRLGLIGSGNGIYLPGISPGLPGNPGWRPSPSRPGKRDCEREYLACAGRGVVVCSTFKALLKPEMKCLGPFADWTENIVTGFAALGYKWACDTQKKDCEDWNKNNGY
jgi:RHS repeat-associated protein